MPTLWQAAEHPEQPHLTKAPLINHDPNLARMEITLIFHKIADIMPNIAKLSEPQRLRSGWINGVKELMVSYHG